ncbi:MAG: response regulator [Proteobacteria bacterium]|nr:response regulator [Pseudomonadota bacterium]
MDHTALAGRRVLVVEDEMLVSLLIEDMLADENCTIVGPYSQFAAALDAARTEAVDLAILDVNIGGTEVYPIAELLAARQIPFLFLSGYGRSAIPAGHPEWQVCSKPFRLEELIGMLVAQLGTQDAA